MIIIAFIHCGSIDIYMEKWRDGEEEGDKHFQKMKLHQIVGVDFVYLKSEFWCQAKEIIY